MVNRQVVGAHYGLKDWIVQRATAVIMLVYTAALILFLLAMPSGYEGWKLLFGQTWVKVLTQTTLIALFLHAWVGIRDLWMDYIKPLGLRIVLHVASLVWLIGCAGWAIQALWRL